MSTAGKFGSLEAAAMHEIARPRMRQHNWDYRLSCDGPATARLGVHVDRRCAQHAVHHLGKESRW